MFDYLWINKIYYGWEKLYNEGAAGIGKTL